MEEVYRVLVVDDLASIHEDFKKILTPTVSPLDEKLENMNAALFGKPKDSVIAPKFTIDSALQGQEGIDLVQASVNEGRPYALAFVDVLMPPGMDGIEAIFGIWAIDPAIQVVICTAYSVYTWEEIIRRLGESDQLYIIKKPFDKIEIVNLAYVLTKRWGISKIIKKQLSKIEAAVSSSELVSRIDIEQSLAVLSAAIGQLKSVNTHLKGSTVKE